VLAAARVLCALTLALVVGNPLTAAMGELWGWRVAVVVVTAAAAAVTLAARVALPPMAGERATSSHTRSSCRSSVMWSVCTGPQAWLLAAYGIAGLIGADGRPAGPSTTNLGGRLSALALALAVLASLAFGGRHTASTLVIMAGSLAGGLLYENAGVPVMIATAAALVAGALLRVAAACRHLLDGPSPGSGCDRCDQ
jgi:hypothetical protein